MLRLETYPKNQIFQRLSGEDSPMKDNKGHGSSKRGMAKVSHAGPIGYKIADIGPGGKEHNIKTNAAWDAHHKAHTPKSSQGSYSNGSHFHGVDNHTMKAAESRFGASTLKKVDAYAHRQKAIAAARNGTSGAPPIAGGRPKR